MKIFNWNLKYKYILILIVLLAIVLRLWRIIDYPALNADEAAIGYNALSLIETGADEHGNPWPIHFQSFNDFKPGLFVYIVIPFVKLFGLSELAVRIPGVLMGVGTVLLIYYLAKELINRERFALLSAFLLAISPWHIHFSRGGWEVNVATFFITLGLLYLLKAVKNPKLYTWSILSFVLALYTYHAARVVIPLLGIGFIVLYLNEVRAEFKKVLLSVVLGFVLLIPLLIDFTGSAGLSRASGVSLFSDPGIVNRINEQRGKYQDPASFYAKVLHNKPINYSLAFGENYLEHFSVDFLFISGDDIERNKVPGFGQLYVYQLLLIVLGIFILIKTSDKFVNKKAWKLIAVWLLAAPVAAALTFQSPHALRSHSMVIPLTLLSACGLYYLIGFLKTKNILGKIGIVSIGLIICTSFVRYQRQYWINMARAYPFSSQYGVKELVSYVKQNTNKYEYIIITTRYDQPYILTLFYLKYPPINFQKEHKLTKRDDYGFSTVSEFDKYRFIPLNKWGDVVDEYSNSLIAGTDEETPSEANIIDNIYGSNGHLYFKLVEN